MMLTPRRAKTSSRQRGSVEVPDRCGDAIQNVLQEVEEIIKNVADNPATPASSMFDAILRFML